MIHPSMGRETLQELYWTRGLSQRDIAQMVGLARTTVRYYMRKFGVSSRPQKQRTKRSNEKVSATMKGLLPWNTGKQLSPKHKKKLSENNAKYWLGKHRSPKTRVKLREARVKQVFPNQETSIEIAMQKELTHRGLKFDKHVSVCGVSQPDIVFPSKRIAIFCDGDYWHNLPRYKVRDKRINKTLRRNGWDVYRFWEHEINSDIKGCVDKIEFS